MYPQSKGLPAFPKRLKKIISLHTRKCAVRPSCNCSAMLNFGESADRALPERALMLAADRTSGSMTLSERVHGLFEQLHGPVFRYLLRKTRDSGRAEDITQETFLRLFRHLSEDRQLDNPKAWLFTVASNLAVDASRDESHIRDLDESTWKSIEESRSGLQADPEKLTPLQRECLHLRAEGLRYREIAGLLELSPSTVMDAVRRATLKLAREFDGEVSA
jgi:RNA polymerase sigma-70 factor (ECF subfamily)